MTTQDRIETRLQALQPQFMEVINESYRHAVPPGSESHFKVTIVSAEFDRKPLIARHRLVNSTLTSDIIQSIHALALHTLTPAEWQKRNAASQGAPESPPCLGSANPEPRTGAKKPDSTPL